MTDVVDLKAAREAKRLIWVCNCGCTVHRAYAEGYIACADCETVGVGAPGEWRARLPEPPEAPRAVSDDCFQVISLDSAATFLKRRLAQPTDDIVFVALAHRDGFVSTYSEGPRKEGKQASWTRRRLRDIADRLIAKKAVAP